MHARSYFASLIVSLYFVAGGDVCPGASTAANHPRSQVPTSLNLPQQAGKLSDDLRPWVWKPLTWGSADPIYPMWKRRTHVSRVQLPSLQRPLKNICMQLVSSFFKGRRSWLKATPHVINQRCTEYRAFTLVLCKEHYEFSSYGRHPHLHLLLPKGVSYCLWGLSDHSIFILSESTSSVQAPGPVYYLLSELCEEIVIMNAAL